MKKLLSVIVLTFIVVGLSGCDLIPSEYQDDVEDLICDDGQILQDGVCVDEETDPACDVDQVLEDGVCVDVTTDPTCDDNQTLVDGECVNNDPNDDRSAAEILADAVVEQWDGSLTHLDGVLQNMNFENSMEFVSEFNFTVTDTSGETEETHYVNVVVTDDYQYADTGTVVERNVALDFEGEVHFINFIFEETETGVIVYVDISDVTGTLTAEDSDLLETLTALGIDQDWLMFAFDDTLENVIELEVLKSMTVDIFFLQMGDAFFYDLQDMLDDELDLLVPTLSTYGIDIGLFVDQLIAEDFDAAQASLDAVDYETLILDLDQAYLVPELVGLLNQYSVELQAEAFPITTSIAYLEANGTEAWLNSLNSMDISILLDVIGEDFVDDPYAPDLSDMFDAYHIGELDHFIMMFFLDDPDVLDALQEIPGFDYDTYYAAMDNLDYQAYYAEAELMTTEDAQALADAIYGGRDAFDAYIITLALTYPETASILPAFSGMVSLVEPYMTIVDDFNYALDNIYVFEDYLDLQYYLDQEIISMSIAETEDFEIETTMVFNAASSGQLFIDLFADTYSFLDGMESFEMPIPDPAGCALDPECTYLEDYLGVIEDLGTLGYAEMVVLYDPSNPDEMSFVVDFSDFAQSLADLDEDDVVVNDLSVKYTVREDSAITIPSEVVDVNQVAQDFAKASLNFMAYDYVRNAMQYYADNSSELLGAIGDHSLDYYGDYMSVSLAFDSEMSYITVGGDALNPTITLTLYWADGTPVFADGVSLADLDSLLDSNPFPSAVDYQTLLDNVDQDNWNISKMIIVYLFTDWDNMEGNQGQEK